MHLQIHLKSTAFSADRRNSLWIERSRRQSSHLETIEIRRRLAALFNKTWLSLQRGPEEFERQEWDPDEIKYTSGVDHKLEEVNGSVARYLTRLDKNVTGLLLDFQRRWFLSFLATGKDTSRSILGRVDIQRDIESADHIFQSFKMPQHSYRTLLEAHGRHTESAFELMKTRKDLTFAQFGIVFDALKLHNLVGQWQELQTEQEKIYEQKYAFAGIANDLLFRKKITFDSSNVIRVTTQKGVDVKLKKLSSGEKQLMIFLAETLLQERRPHIFFADEPELSLHIDWQEKLVPSLLQINPSAQVVFATHSPDIVGPHQSSVINLEHMIDDV